MAITIVQTSVGATQSGANTVATSFANPVSAGNGIVVHTGSNSSQTPSSVTDNSGGSTNTYTKQVEQGDAGGHVVDEFVCLSLVTGGFTTLTAHLSGTGQSWIVAYEVLGTLTAGTHNSHAANEQSQTTGAITTSVADSVVFVSNHATGGITAMPTGYGTGYANPAFTGASFASGYQVFTTIQTAINPSFPDSSSQLHSALASPYTSNNLSGSAYVPIGPHGILLPVDMPVDLPQYIRNGFVLPGTTVNTSTWSPRATVVVPELPRPSLPTSPPINAWLLPQTNNSPSDFHPRLRPVEPVPLPAVAVTPRTSAILFPGFVSPPDVFHRIHSLDLLERSPVGADPRRVARITDKLSQRINSLVRRGEMFRIDNDEWTLRGGARSVARNPASFDDTASGVVIGQLWVNSVTKKLWVCVDATKGAAVWIGPLG